MPQYRCKQVIEAFEIERIEGNSLYTVDGPVIEKPALNKVGFIPVQPGDFIILEPPHPPRTATIVCKHCGSSDTLLEVDWAAYPESAWCRLTIHCRNERCAEAPSELIFEAPVY
jgi:hypothetical protein